MHSSHVKIKFPALEMTNIYLFTEFDLRSEKIVFNSG